MPLFAIVPLDWTVPDPAQFDGLVLTSANAVRHAGTELQRLIALPVHAVGEATAELARAAGFTIASIGAGGSRDMALPRGQRLLHLAGRDHNDTGAATIIPVYEARRIDRPPGLDALQDCVVAVHSPRAGKRLAELVANRSRIAIAAISTAAAEACGGGWERVEVASRPADDALLALAARLCESPAP
jgi:uroporphyrinogen-III synthase